MGAPSSFLPSIFILEAVRYSNSVAVKSISLSGRQLSLISKALADPRRYEILEKLGRAGDQCACGDIRECIPVTAATLSHHMKELENAGLIDSERDGKFVNYKIRRDVLAAYLQRLAKI